MLSSFRVILSLYKEGIEKASSIILFRRVLLSLYNLRHVGKKRAN